jgi:hypothetical protein
LRERDHLGNLGIDGMIILKLIFSGGMGWHGLVCCGSGMGQVVSCCECGDELVGSIWFGNFLTS